GDLGLLLEPRQVLRPLQTPPAGPALPRRVTVERGDEVNQQFSHGRLLVLTVLVSGQLSYHGRERVGHVGAENEVGEAELLASALDLLGGGRQGHREVPRGSPRREAQKCRCRGAP